MGGFVDYKAKALVSTSCCFPVMMLIQFITANLFIRES